jgi:hypothetical protein
MLLLLFSSVMIFNDFSNSSMSLLFLYGM